MAQQPITFTTPKGIAQYPWLSKPDTKFSEEGTFAHEVAFEALSAYLEL